jgi:uncharacterized protein YodC (DUF2158 family)
MPFKPGDPVRLKSGSGPEMTVLKIVNGSVDCTWFDDKQKVQSGSFPSEILELDDPGAFAIVQ